MDVVRIATLGFRLNSHVLMQDSVLIRFWISRSNPSLILVLRR